MPGYGNHLIDDVWETTVTIAAAGNLSGASAALQGRLIAVKTAATWDAAKVSFQVSSDGTNYNVLSFEGTEYSTAAITGANYCAVEPGHFFGARNIKIQSGTSTATTAQADETIVTLVCWTL